MSAATALPTPVAEIEACYWKPGSRVHIPAEVAAAEFRKIKEAFGGVTPARVVERAAKPKAPLHECFEWDDTKAGPAFRETQAQYLIRSCVVVYRKADNTLTPPMRYLVKVTPGPVEDRAEDFDNVAFQPRHYVTMTQAMSEEELRRRLVLKALQDLIAWRQRYKDMAEFARVFEMVDQLRKEHGA